MAKVQSRPASECVATTDGYGGGLATIRIARQAQAPESLVT